MGSRLSSLVVQEGFLRLEALKDALALQVIKGGELDTILLEKRLLDEPTLIALLSRATGFPPLVPALLRGEPGALRELVPVEAADKLGICPIAEEPGAVSILVSAASDQVALEELAFELDRRLSPFVAPEVRLLEARERVYGVPVGARYQRLLERLGAPPLPADLRAGGAVELPPLTPTIEPRRSSPGLAPEAVPEPSPAAGIDAAPAVARGAAAPAAPDPGSVETVHSPPAAELTDRRLFEIVEERPLAPEPVEPPAVPKNITDEFPPLERPAPAEPPTVAALAAATAAEAPQGAPATPVEEPAEATAAAEELPPVAAGTIVPEMPPIPPDAREAPPMGEELELAPEELVPDHEAEAAARQPTGPFPAVEQAPPREATGPFPAVLARPPTGPFAALLREPTGPHPSVVLGVSAPAAPAHSAALPDEAVALGIPIAPTSPALEVDPESTSLAVEDATRAMAAAAGRDELLLALARGAHGLLECVQLYVMREGRLQGWLEITSGRVDRSDVRRRKLSLEASSVVSRAVEDGSLFIGPAPDTDASGATLIAAGILALRGLVLLPIHLKGKTVCLVAGHDYDRPISQRLRAPLMQLADEAAQAFAQLIVRQKHGGQRRDEAAGGSSAVGPAASPAEPAPEQAPPLQLVPPAADDHPRPGVSAPSETALTAVPPAAHPTPPERPSVRARATPLPGVVFGEIVVNPPPAAAREEKPPAVVVEVPPAGYPFDLVQPTAGASVDTRAERDTLRMPVMPRRPAEGPLQLELALAEIERGGEAGAQALERLTASGTPVIRELIERFPGRLRFDRGAPRTQLPPVGECSAVLRALVAFGRQVLLHIPPLFHHTDADVRFYATYLMSELVYPEGVALLATRLQDSDPETRRVAAQILRRFKEMEQFPGVLLDLRSDLTNPDSRPRRAAVEALSALGDGESVPALADLLEDSDFGVRESALNALVSLTKQDFGPSARRWLTWWERNAHRHRVEWLIDGLVHKAPEIRASAAGDLLEITGESFGYSFDLGRREREAVRRKFVDWWAEQGVFKFGPQGR
jgi:hypothetical protein